MFIEPPWILAALFSRGRSRPSYRAVGWGEQHVQPTNLPNEALQPTVLPLDLSSFGVMSAATFLSAFVRGASAELGHSTGGIMSNRVVIEKLSLLLNNHSKEQVIHEYIEQHPWLVTGTRYLDPDIVISKPPLGADHRPDFAYFWHHSGGQFIELVEIEKPDLEVFTENDEFTAPFNHAVQQVADWEDWCERHSTVVSDLMEPLFDMGLITGIPTFAAVRSNLIAGRREHIKVNARRRKRWEKKVGEVPMRKIRTWDGYLESFPGAYYECSSSWLHTQCVRYRNQKFELINPRIVQQ